MPPKPIVPMLPIIAATKSATPVANQRPVPADRKRRQLQADLDRRGVAAEFSTAICDRLAPFSEDLTPELYDAVLSGVAMAYGVHRRDVEGRHAAKPNLGEVERLMTGFVSELRKLDEALETLAAYVSRLRCETTRDPGTFH